MIDTKTKSFRLLLCANFMLTVSVLVDADACGQKQRQRYLKMDEVDYPPKLPSDKKFITVQSEKMLVAPEHIAKEIQVAEVAPKIDLAFFPGQDYPGNPWSNWGDSLAVGDKYYASIGDHLAPAGNAFVYEYDPEEKSFRLLANVFETLKLKPDHYVPGKIHTRLDMGRDGWIYFGTHRGSTRVTSDQYHYRGDWMMRCHPKTGACEVVARNPVSKHCIPTSIVDTERMIFYASTAPGSDAEKTDIQFFAYDLANRKLLYSGGKGPARAIALSNSTGKVYFHPKDSDTLMGFNPATDKAPRKILDGANIRAASAETKNGLIYFVSAGRGVAAELFEFDTKTEKMTKLGPAAIGDQNYITTLDIDSTGRFIYYVPGAHGGSWKDGTPMIQYDIKKKKRKVIAFLEPFFDQKYGFKLCGTYSIAISPEDDKLFVTWNVSRGTKAWDCCALTTIHIPESERITK